MGAYIAFMFAGVAFVAAGTLWNTVSGGANVAQAQVTDVKASTSEADLPTLLMPPAAPVAPIGSPEALPPQQGGASQSSAQQLTAGLEAAVPAPTASSGPIAPRSILTNVNITFYDCANQGFCGAMYNGRKVYEGAAACSWNLPIGTRFIIVGDPTHRIYICEDRGLLANTWVDIFWYYPSQGHSWQSIVGRYGTIEIISMP